LKAYWSIFSSSKIWILLEEEMITEEVGVGEKRIGFAGASWGGEGGKKTASL